ncbi:leiomodin 2 [Rhinolophus ferrumequinum]|uniref:Leiomodin-2 n=1 Tax=Rhinolophus ferrumequinum TaxID=59479 RepID=A0A671FFU8_RHIFE|nr:leiomodin-2 [Rhinolophus ferrumequinum]KAF6276057.1 leiomodin 2 [Rhinolophus ferrumequinum]
MSTFGYRRGLSKYESIDEDELLASLSAEELKELERELEDIEPDRNLPVGLRQKSLTEKTPTGTFSREALMAYWEKESQKLLEKERLGECGKVAEEDKEESEEELIFTESNSEVSEEVYTEEEGEDEHEDEQEEEDEDEDEDEDSDEEERAIDNEKGINGTVNYESVNSDNSRPKTFKSQIENISLTNGHSGRNAESPAAIHPCGNPTVIEDALEKIRNNDPDTTEVNLNNIENITSQTLARFAEALKDNTVVKTFSLANTHADDSAALAIADMLRVNEHITNLNIDSNFITGKGILAIMRALQRNAVLTELRFHNQRHIMGSQVEMEIVKLLRDNTTLLRLGYHFELPGPRMSMTSLLTRNMDKQRQKRMQEQKQQEGYDGGSNLRTKVWQRGTPGSSPCASPWSSPKLPKKAQTVRSRPASPVAPPPPPPPPPLPPQRLPPPPPPPPPPLPDKKYITRNIAEVIKQQESAQRALQNGQKKKKGKKVKKQPNNILKEIKNSLRSVQEKKMEDSSRPSTPQRSAHDNLMEAIRGSSIKQLRRVEVPAALQ